MDPTQRMIVVKHLILTVIVVAHGEDGNKDIVKRGMPGDTIRYKKTIALHQ